MRYGGHEFSAHIYLRLVSYLGVFASHERHRDAFLQRGREGSAGYFANCLTVHLHRVTLPRHHATFYFEPYQLAGSTLLANATDNLRSDELLALTNHPAQPRLDGVDVFVQLVTVQRIARLYTQHVPCAQTAGHGARLV